MSNIDPPEEHTERSNYTDVYAYWREFIPDHFYWAIPYSLLEICEEMNEGLPYGIYVFDRPKMIDSYSSTHFYKSPRPLNARTRHAYYEMFNRVSTLWAVDRGKIKRLEEGKNEKAS